MDNKLIDLIIGSLLHDIGKVIYRTKNQKINHSELGYEYLEKLTKEKPILDCVKYHHGKFLKNADIENDSIAYITYIADNIAANLDRKKDLEYDSEDESDFIIFDKYMLQDSIFNRIKIVKNNENQMSNYSDEILKSKYNLTYFINDKTNDINFPQNDKTKAYSNEYSQIWDNLKDKINNIPFEQKYINSILNTLEAYLSYIPSSTNVKEIPDISLYDHLKVTASVASCIYYYLKFNNIDNYREKLFKKSDEFYEKQAFLLLACDTSGIQNFIKIVGNKKVLKSLRSRSFYLEIMMENIIDEILDSLKLSRANVMYSGGGHAYLLIPNVKEAIDIINDKEKEINDWLLKKYNIDLYMAMAYVPLSSNDLKSGDTYNKSFEKLGKILSKKKNSRYTVDALIKLNSYKELNDRECKICKRSDDTVKSDGENSNICESCQTFQNISSNLINKNYEAFGIYNYKKYDNMVEIYKDRYMKCLTKKELRDELIKNDSDLIRSYYKNNMYIGKSLSSNIWMGDFVGRDNEFSDIASSAKGINRIGVLRMDVDNLGKTFSNGFDKKISTISRTSTFSRQLNIFFKYYINNILEKPKYYIPDSKKVERNCTIVYSGGDDVFIIGPWNQIIELAIDIHDAFEKFTDGKLKISCGIGMYYPTYPLRLIVDDSENLEECSKINGKNKITLFSKEFVFDWNEFKNDVLENYLKNLYIYMKYNFVDENVGMSMIYKITEYIRNYVNNDSKIDKIRLLYLLSRFEPKKEENLEKFNQFKQFIIMTIQKGKIEINKLICAIYIYVYLNRENNKEE